MIYRISSIVPKVAGENTGNGGPPRLVFSPIAKWEMFFADVGVFTNSKWKMFFHF